jgi:hypothetical protein
MIWKKTGTLQKTMIRRRAASEKWKLGNICRYEIILFYFSEPRMTSVCMQF